MTEESESSETLVGEEIVFRKIENLNADEVWDDTALIEAYDRAINLTYDAVHASIGEEPSASKKSQTTSDPKKSRRRTKYDKVPEWRVGDSCLARFSADGELYEAQIVTLDHSSDKCVVCYVGYEEEEEQPISALHKYALAYHRRRRRVLKRPLLNVHSWSKMFRLDETPTTNELESSLDLGTEEDTRTDGKEKTKGTTSALSNLASSSHTHSQLPVLPPPPPPSWLSSKLPKEDEALSSMLMAWYMSGYHTGYYQAMQEMKKSRHRSNH